MVQRSDFTWLERLGEGSFGVVHRVIHRKTGDIYAIKSSKHSLSSNDCQTFHQELSFISKLRHRNIIDHVCSFEQENKLYIVTEYLPFNLLTHIETSVINNEKFHHDSSITRAITENSCRSLIHQLLLALSHIHNKGIIHRDIKPENILIDSSNNRLVLCDFGFARFVPQSHTGELTGYIATRWYRAPELLLKFHHYTAAVDMWAVGCVLGEMIDGFPLFDADTDIDSLYQIAQTLNSQELNDEIERLGLIIKNNDLNVKSLETRWDHLVSKECIDFIYQLLRINDSERMTANEALKHPWITQIQTQKETEPTETFYHSVNDSVVDNEIIDNHTTNEIIEESKEQIITTESNKEKNMTNSVVNSPTMTKKKLQWKEEKENEVNENFLSHVTLSFEFDQNSLIQKPNESINNNSRIQQILKVRHNNNNHRHSVISEENNNKYLNYNKTKTFRPVQLTPVSSPPHSRSQSISVQQPFIMKISPLLEPISFITGHSLLTGQPQQTPRESINNSGNEECNSNVEGINVNEREAQRRGRQMKPALLPAFHNSFDPHSHARHSSLTNTNNNNNNINVNNVNGINIIDETRPLSKGVKKRSELNDLTAIASISLAGHSFASLGSYRPIQPNPPPANNRNRRQTQKIVPINH